jgi:hypothetical protein
MAGRAMMVDILISLVFFLVALWVARAIAGKTVFKGGM